MADNERNEKDAAIAAARAAFVAAQQQHGSQSPQARAAGMVAMKLMSKR